MSWHFLASHHTNFLAEILFDPFKYQLYEIFFLSQIRRRRRRRRKRREELEGKKRRECIWDDWSRMGSSPADSHFINNESSHRVMMMMMMAVPCWIPTPERFSFFLTLSSSSSSSSTTTLYPPLTSFFSCRRRRPPSPSSRSSFLLLLHMADTQVRDGRRRRRRRPGGREKERTRVKDDCMSNLRHGDYNYVTFALVLLLHSFFAQSSSNPIRRTRLFLLLCVCARARTCMCARICEYIYMRCVCLRQNTHSLVLIDFVWTYVLLIFLFNSI